jgi:hypothetical protein
MLVLAHCAVSKYAVKQKQMTMTRGERSVLMEPSCGLFHHCQSQTDDEGRKDCLVRNDARL